MNESESLYVLINAPELFSQTEQEILIKTNDFKRINILTEEEFIPYFKKFYPLFMSKGSRLAEGICQMVELKFKREEILGILNIYPFFLFKKHNDLAMLFDYLEKHGISLK